MGRIYRYLEELLFIYPQRAAKFASWVGWPMALKLLFCQLLRKRETISVQVGGVDLSIRTNASDIMVAAENLFYREYAGLKCGQPKVIVDAGGNIGTSAIYFARTFPEARIFVMEPQPDNFALLEKNCRPYSNITPLNLALGARTGKISMAGDPECAWGYTVSESPGAQQIDCVPLAKLMEKYSIPHIDLLKIDIEGSEREVFENSTDWIDKVDTIAVELHDGLQMGCSRAFYFATKNFGRFERSGEMTMAYRQ